MDDPRDTLKRYHMPGVSEDQEGNLHFALPDILEALGEPVTQKRQEELMGEIEKVLLKTSPETQMVVRTERPTGPGWAAPQEERQAS